jgi:hypothetical protein
MDELDEKVLDIQQRQKRAQIMRRYASKIERAREISKKRMAPEANIRKRAFAMARQLVRKRVAGTRGAEYEKLGPSEKISIDRAVEGKQKQIKKLALRLIPRVKQAEQKRLSSYMKGQQLQNHGQKEGKSKESSGASSVKESINNLFQEAFPPGDTSNAMGQNVASPVSQNGKRMPAKGKSKSSEIIQHNKFQEEVELDTPAFAALFKKSEKSGIDLEVLGEVYDRGWNTWTEDCKVSQQQYAFARVNSYINQGKTYFNEDSDLHEGMDKTHPIVKEYNALKKHDIKTLRGMISQHHKVVDTSEFKTKDHAISHFLRQKHGNKKVDQAFGFNEETDLDEARAPGRAYVAPFNDEQGNQKGWKSSNKWGKVKYWQPHAKKSALKHAGLQEEEVQQTNENFIDGKGPGKPGDSARHGLKGKSAAELRKIRSSDSASPRKKQLAHWMLNMHHNEETDIQELSAKAITAYRRGMEKDVATNPDIDPKKKAQRERGFKTSTKKILGLAKVNATESLKDPEDNPCWKGYKPVGTKKKGGKTVPNCVPVNEEDTGNGTNLTDKESKNSKTRKKIEVVDRKAPYTDYIRHAEIKNKVIDEEHTKCGTPECCGQCDTAVVEKIGNTQNDPKKRLIGTDSLVKAYKKDTPFSESLDESFNIAFASGVGVTLTAGDLGMKVKGGFALHPSVIEQMDEMEEEVRSADVEGVVVRTATGKTVVRKQKVNHKIIKTGNLTDGKPDDTV